MATVEDGNSAIHLGPWSTPMGQPFGQRIPVIECVACAERTTHDEYEIYEPVRHYRQIAADFIRVRDDTSALAFAKAWGLVRAHQLESDPRHHPMQSTAMAERFGFLSWAGSYHDATPDLIDDIVGWSTRAARLHDLAYDDREDRRERGLRDVAAVIRTMVVDFVPQRGLAIQVMPASLLHIVFYALLGLYRGRARLVCGEWLASGCSKDIPVPEGSGRPRKYCSDRCASRARNRRRGRQIEENPF